MNDNARIGKMLRLLRKSQKATLEEVSISTGLSISYISDIERGRRLGKLATINKLADCYGMRVEIKLRPK
jgi:transcriptional regulator with XRE-family HTH domain